VVDIITAEIVRNYLETVCKEMSSTVENTAMSPIFTLNHDYSCGVFYLGQTGVELVARDAAVPVHIFAALDSAKMVFEYFGEDIHPGDVFLVTDPYMGGTHCPDWTVIKPMFFGDGVSFLPCVRGHVNDVGGPVPGNYNVDARDVWQEGFRITPIRLIDQGEPNVELWELLMANTRLPDDVRGDLWAMVGACIIAERRIEELSTRYGEPALRSSVDYVLNHSETQFRSVIESWPDGVYTATEYVDHDYAGSHDIPVNVAVTVEGSSLTVDFTGTSPQAPGFINSPRGNTMSQIFTALEAMVPDIPVNSGQFKPVTAILPQDSLVNPSSPAPVGHCTLMPGTTLIDAVMRCMEQIAPTLVGTAVCDWNSARSFGVRDGSGKYWIHSDPFGTPMSAGGAHGVDGWGAWSATFAALRLPPLEETEMQYPYLYELAEYATDTAAPGQWRGAPAFHYRRVNTEGMRTTIYNGSYRNRVAGYVGGHRAAGNYFVLNEQTADETKVTDQCFAVPLAAGSRLFAQSSAGGGWGSPLDRDPQAVLDDCLDELVSVGAAANLYGVVIDPGSWTVDVERTDELRRQLRTST